MKQTKELKKKKSTKFDFKWDSLTDNFKVTIAK